MKNYGYHYKMQKLNYKAKQRRKNLNKPFMSEENRLLNNILIVFITKHFKMVFKTINVLYVIIYLYFI